MWNEENKLALKVPAEKDWPDLYKWITIPERKVDVHHIYPEDWLKQKRTEKSASRQANKSMISTNSAASTLKKPGQDKKKVQFSP